MTFEDFFDYPKLIGELTLEQKRKFYVLLAHDLTIAVRGIWSNEKLSDAEKVEGMKAINEIMHRLIFRVEELHKVSRKEDDSWTEDDFWTLIKDYVSDNPKVTAGEVARSIKFSYERCCSV
jgi:hypothetical protein